MMLRLWHKTSVLVSLLGVLAFGCIATPEQVMKQQMAHVKPASNAQTYPEGKITFIKNATWRRNGDFFEIIGDLYAMNPDGSRQTLLKKKIEVPYGVNPYRELSPDGRKRAFSQAGDIYIENLDGSGKIQLTTYTAPNPYSASPSWSPDGKRIVFESGTIFEYRPSTSIYVINTDGSGLKRLTQTQEEEDENPVFSPDGRKIAFKRGIHIYVMNADGSQQKQLTREQLTRALSRVDFPTWSPDGRKIAFQAESSDPEKVSFPEIFVINSDGTKETRLTREESLFPFWVRKTTGIK